MTYAHSPRLQLWHALNELCPLRLAGSWDQVGPMVDPFIVQTGPERIFLTIDLTEEVYQEAKEANSSVIIAYHPLLFHPLKRLDLSNAISRVSMQAIQDGVAIYSPHSALDAVSGGICDWLSQFFSEFGLTSVVPIESDSLSPHEGAGRLLILARPQTFEQIASHLQHKLGLTYLRVAAPDQLKRGHERIERIALCPGAGAGLFAQCAPVHAGGPQLYFTGEMSHHDVLHRVREGAGVVLTEHTRCERGYLEVYAEQLRTHLSADLCTSVTISKRDQDPLSLYK